MKKLTAKIEIEVPDGFVKTRATADGLADTRETIPSSITPILIVADGSDVGRFEEKHSEKKIPWVV